MMQNTSEQRLQQILTVSPAIIYACRATGDFGATFVSKNITELFGYTVQDCLENPGFWRENIHPEDRVRVFASYDQLFKTGRHIHEYRFRTKNGSYLWVHDELRLLRDPDGEPLEIIGSWLDITDRKEIEAALHKSERLFREFFMVNPVATIITSPSGTVHMVNPAFVAASGYTADDVVGRTSQELGFWRDLEDRERMVAAIQTHGYINNLEAQFFGKDQKPMTCLVSSRAVEYEGETRILSIVIDVSEQRKAEEFLKKLDQAKSDFIATAAHELRTPLIAVMGYAELLEYAEQGGLSLEKQQQYAKVVRQNAEVLNRLVDDLLDIGRIQLGQPLVVIPEPATLSVLLTRVVDAFRLKCRQVNFEVLHTNDLPPSMMIDEGRITQVLNNILGNAVKYSPQGGTIRIRTTTAENRVDIAIADEGIGMSAEQIERIFERFYRADYANPQFIGLGIGMSVVKQIIDDHGGAISVTSQTGKGTTVTFTLPLATPPGDY